MSGEPERGPQWSESSRTASWRAVACVSGDMSDSETRPVLSVPTPTEIVGSLPSEAVQYDPDNPPVSGSVQRESDGPAR